MFSWNLGLHDYHECTPLSDGTYFGLLCLYKKNQHPPNCVPVNQCFVVCFKSRVFFISRWFSLFLTTKTPEKQHIRPRSTIHHTHHIITAWEPGSCVSPLGLEMESAENRGQKNIVNITILQFWFGLFFNFLLLSLHFFLFLRRERVNLWFEYLFCTFKLL